MTTGERIQEERNRLGLSKNKLAKLVGIARNTICQLENDKNGMTLYTACKLADVFGVTIDYLAGRSEKP